ncbi:AMP-binding protein [Paenibacillus rhizoplanae]
MFEEQAARRPEAAAVACGGTVLSYGQLDLLSNRLARTLRKTGVKPNMVVGIFSEPFGRADNGNSGCVEGWSWLCSSRPRLSCCTG